MTNTSSRRERFSVIPERPPEHERSCTLGVKRINLPDAPFKIGLLHNRDPRNSLPLLRTGFFLIRSADSDALGRKPRQWLAISLRSMPRVRIPFRIPRVTKKPHVLRREGFFDDNGSPQNDNVELFKPMISLIRGNFAEWYEFIEDAHRRINPRAK